MRMHGFRRKQLTVIKKVIKRGGVINIYDERYRTFCNVSLGSFNAIIEIHPDEKMFTNELMGIYNSYKESML